MAGFATGGHPKRHYYTTQDIARLTGRAVGTVHNDSAAGRIDLDDLGSVCQYIKYFEYRAASVAMREKILERMSA